MHNRPSPSGLAMTAPNLGALYLEHREKLIRVAAAVLHQNGLHDGAMDVVQQVFEELLERPPAGHVNSWEALLVQRTKQRAIDHGRKQHADKRGPSFDDDFDLHDPTAEEVLERAEAAIDLVARRGDLLDAMSHLTDNERHVIVRQEFDEVARAELADELGVTPPRISQIRKSALDKLRAHMEKE
ncbi:sigma-70 family RNA polymerase sigma factor [Microbacterium aerolatum]|uniref:sigma-70 family RNA polymerase sigma factor n=1 Tax=Microbacterium aerolatum TaxID=153731 RepID=UPI00384B3B85